MEEVNLSTTKEFLVKIGLTLSDEKDQEQLINILSYLDKIIKETDAQQFFAPPGIEWISPIEAVIKETGEHCTIKYSTTNIHRRPYIKYGNAPNLGRPKKEPEPIEPPHDASTTEPTNR